MSKYRGARVLEPIVGRHKSVACSDLKSLYIMVMMKYNISPETLSKTGDIKIGNGIRFSSEKEGVVPRIIKRLENERNIYKNKLKKMSKDDKDYTKIFTLQNAMKIASRSFYGTFGSDKGAWFDPDIAGSITFKAREIIGCVMDVVEKHSEKLIYGHTDSTFYQCKDYEHAQEITNKINDKLDDKYNGIEIELEYYAPSFFIHSANRYACMISQPFEDFKIVGYETKQWGMPKPTKDIQREVLRMVLEYLSEEEVIGYLNGVVYNIRHRNYPLEELAIRRRIKKNIKDYKVVSYHVRGALYANNYLDCHLGMGDMPYTYYINKVPDGYESTDILSVENVNQTHGFRFDYDKFIDVMIKSKVASIFEAMKWNLYKVDPKNRFLEEYL